MISAETIVAAIESRSPRHVDEMAITYGDLVVVKEIYQDGWATGIKLRKKVWEDESLNTPLESKAENGVVHLFKSPNYENSPGSGTIYPGSPQTYLFDLRHFCHSETWDEVRTLS